MMTSDSLFRCPRPNFELSGTSPFKDVLVKNKTVLFWRQGRITRPSLTNSLHLTNQPTNQLNDWPTDWSIIQTTNWRMDQPTNWLNNQPNDQPTNQLTNCETKQLTDQAHTHPTN